MRKLYGDLFLIRRLGLLFLASALSIFIIGAVINHVFAAEVNKSYISSFGIKSTDDGTAPWDDNDEVGNDSASNNGIIRSFDHVNYNLSYVTSLMEGEHVVDEGNLMAQFELNVDPRVAQFDADTLNWMEDRKIVYTYSDGTTSETWNKNKTVTKQVYTGYRHLTVNENGTNAIPGAGSLSAGVYVRAAQNGDVIQPSFQIWMEGNADGLKKSAEGTRVTVTAAPRYNLRLSHNTADDPLGYFNFSNGTISDDQVSGAEYGRLEGYAMGIYLHNTQVSKGLRGIEIPTGDITFDINLSAILTDSSGSRDVTNEAAFAPVLWDYTEHANKDINRRGHLNRKMAHHNVNLSFGQHLMPGNKGTTDHYCYDGGKLSLEQDATSPNIYHVTIKDYAFDLENLRFPVHYLDDANTYTRDDKNVGWFTTGYYEFLIRFPETVESTSVILTTVKAENLQATSLSGVPMMSETNNDDNSHSYNVTVLPNGTFSSYAIPLNENKRNTSNPWNGGAAYAYIGTDGYVSVRNAFSGDGRISMINNLVKFEDKYIDITNEAKTINRATLPEVIRDYKVLFAAKPDKSGWASDSEMNSMREEGLIYFEDVDVLKSKGYTCVGVLIELRDTQLYSSEHTYNFKIKVKGDPESVGKTAMFKQETRAWRSTSEDLDLSWTNYSYTGESDAFGAGDASMARGQYVSDYLAPYVDYHKNYTRTIYADGSIIGGHSGSIYAGSTVLLVGAENRISIEVNDKTETDGGNQETKRIYDLDKGEREAEFKISPSVNIASASSGTDITNQKTNVTVKALLPKELTYIVGSANTAPIEISNNDDGSSVITWLIRDVTIGEPMDDIIFKTTIGAAGTVNDVSNNDNIAIQATITSDADMRKIIAAYNNIAETSITVVKLATSSVSKIVGSQLSEAGSDISYFLRYGNSNEDEVLGVRALDVLSYNGDGRDTNFHGDYRVKTVTLDFVDAPNTYTSAKNLAAVYQTNSASVRDNSGVNDVLVNETGKTWTRLTGGETDDDNKSITFDVSLRGVTALYFDIGKVNPKEYVVMKVVLSPVDESGNLYQVDGEGQKGGDIYANNFYEYANEQIGVVTSNQVQTQVVSRTLSGLAWYDKNANGIRDTNESVLSNVMVSLLDSTGAKARNVLGAEIADISTNSEGEYSFALLPSGQYVVQIVGGDYGLTTKDVGDDGVDSDATPKVSNGQLEAAQISVTLPEASAMPSYTYDSRNNDAGFTRANLKIKKTNNAGDVLSGSKFGFGDRIYDAANGIVELAELGVGSMSLVEREAPEGYKIGGPWMVDVVVGNNGAISASVADVTLKDGFYEIKNDLNDSSMKNKIVKGSATTEMTDKGQSIDYKITYNVELTDYIGKAIVKVVDSLPYPIVSEQSQLDGGIYDASARTITWEKEWDNINTYRGENTKTFEFNISVVYDGVASTDRELKNEAIGETTLVDVEAAVADNTEPGDYEDDELMPIKIPGQIIVHYVEDETNKVVCSEVNASGLVGDAYRTRVKECTGYKLMRKPSSEDYTFGDAVQHVYYYYVKLPDDLNPNTVDMIDVVVILSIPAFLGGISVFMYSKQRR